jgi:hypothetical protein
MSCGPGGVLCRSVAGLCTGVAFRKVGRTLAVGLGFTFVALQGLQYFGIIETIRCVAVVCFFTSPQASPPPQHWRRWGRRTCWFAKMGT